MVADKFFWREFGQRTVVGLKRSHGVSLSNKIKCALMAPSIIAVTLYQES